MSYIFSFCGFGRFRVIFGNCIRHFARVPNTFIFTFQAEHHHLRAGNRDLSGGVGRRLGDLKQSILVLPTQSEMTTLKTPFHEDLAESSANSLRAVLFSSVLAGLLKNYVLSTNIQLLQNMFNDVL